MKWEHKARKCRFCQSGILFFFYFSIHALQRNKLQKFYENNKAANFIQSVKKQYVCLLP